MVVWITGLSGAGKTTLAKMVTDILRKMDKCVVMLDGDDLREIFENSGHSREERLKLAFQYAKLCKLLAENGMIVVIATIALFKEVHIWNRKNLSGYFEVYLKVPMDELIKRDPKGIYKKYFQGKLKNVYGLDLEFDEPEAPEMVVEFGSKKTLKEIAQEIVRSLFS